MTSSLQLLCPYGVALEAIRKVVRNFPQEQIRGIGKRSACVSLFHMIIGCLRYQAVAEDDSC